MSAANSQKAARSKNGRVSYSSRPQGPAAAAAAGAARWPYRWRVTGGWISPGAGELVHQILGGRRRERNHDLPRRTGTAKCRRSFHPVEHDLAVGAPPGLHRRPARDRPSCTCAVRLHQRALAGRQRVRLVRRRHQERHPALRHLHQRRDAEHDHADDRCRARAPGACAMFLTPTWIWTRLGSRCPIAPMTMCTEPSVRLKSTLLLARSFGR